MSFETDVRKWVDSTRPYNWLNQCAGLTMSICRHFGNAPAVGQGGAYSTATAAYEAADIESADPAKAPVGAIHYWSYTAEINGVRRDYGHVVVDIRGKGTHVLSATRNASPKWGVNAGLISVARQTKLIGRSGRYLGWSRLYGSRYRVTVPEAPAGGNPRPLEDEVPTITETKFAPGQVIKEREQPYLLINKEGHNTVVAGPATVVGATLEFRATHKGGPFDTGGYVPVVQVVALVEDWDGKKVTKSRSLGRHEVTVTADTTFQSISIRPVKLAKNQRLRFRVVPFGVDQITIGECVFVAAVYTS